ncbi:MAG TPA: hypothetical protein VGG72_16450 [Bryobacteraceae bacterium]|jgi:hypothetical protein
MKQFILKSQSALLSIAGALIVCLCAPGTSQAATTPRNLTVVVNPAGAGITIVDQVSGVVTHCGLRANFPDNIATCVRVGKATPDATVPTPPVGLSVYLAQDTSTAGASQAAPGIWIINNSTGDITYCNAVDQAGTPSGSCADLGVAPAS